MAPTAAHAQHDHVAPESGRWTWSGHGQVFLNLNLQDRKFTDFRHVESQNWGMVVVARRMARVRVSAQAMVSAEPWTLRRLGSAQVLQLGETLDGAPLLDYQHPHDLIMGLEARVEYPAGSRTTVFVAGGPVGSAALGPQPFMHRPSAGPNPTAPLSHHMQDATHISHGVVTAGMSSGRWMVEASVFRGREPDEDRVRLDLGALDSVSARVAWQMGPWRAQVSSGRLNEPEAAEPGDVVRSTASIEYDRSSSGGDRRAWMASWGRNDRRSHTETGWLVEGRRGVTPGNTVYGRAELVDRFLLVDFGYAAATGQERHLPSWVAALTVGYERALARRFGATLGLGADVTLHRVSANLRESYGGPVSWHIFLRAGRR